MITQEQRRSAAMQLLDETEAIALHSRVRSQVPEIAERAERIRARGMIVVSPVAEVADSSGAYFEILTQWKSSGNSGKEVLKFYPCFPEDTQLGKGTAYFTGMISGGGYRCQPHMIQMNMQAEETPRFMACAFLHELGHAYAAEDEGRTLQNNTRSLEERLAEEVRMWTADYKLMIALGGQAFAEAISFKAMDLVEAWDKQTTSSFSFEGQGTSLMACWGPPPTARSVQNRDYSFGIYCQFFAADNYLDTAMAQRQKILVLQSSYEGGYAKEGAFAALFPPVSQ